jgi:hypothetical protein
VNKHELAALVESLTAELVALQTDNAYYDNALQDAHDAYCRQQAVIDQHLAYIETLMTRIVELTGVIDENDAAFETIGNTLRASTQLQLRSN